MRVLIELWPALIPFALCFAIMLLRRRVAVKRDEQKPRFREGPWRMAFFASVATAMICLFLYGVSAESVKGTYVPARVENGRMVPGEVRP